MPKGRNASPGIAIGKALVLEQGELKIQKLNIKDAATEEKKLREAVEISKVELTKIKEKAAINLGAEKAEIFEAHLMVLEDPELIDSTLNKIKTEMINAEFALHEIRNGFIEIFNSMDNEYMRERASDIKDVTDRVLRNILNVKYVELSSLEEEVILVAHDLTPSDTATMNKEKVLGFLTDIGGRTSHTAIMARTLEIPAVVGLKDITEVVKDNDFIILNGDTGEVFINPEEEIINNYRRMKEELEEDRKGLKTFIGLESKTLDEKHVELAGNIGTPEDLQSLCKHDAEGVGLFRTEFLYMNRNDFPSEEEQYLAYKEVLETLKSKPVVIRTLDIGGDKELPYLKLDKEMNPFLGHRAIRLCLNRTDIFKTQLRALLRASIYGNLRIMFPMISSLEELLAAKSVLEEVKEELNKQNISYSSNIEIGMMIEIPSAALVSDILAKHVDFFSIGTNDLIQYTCAVDRMNEKIHHLYTPFNPGVLRLIKMVIDNGHKEGKWVGMCGEAAGNKKMVPILLGMGLDEFSMSPVSILPTRKLISSLKYSEMKEFSDSILQLGSAEEIEAYIDNNLNL